MRKITWYFDFISPYAYFSTYALDRLGRDIDLLPQPILFAALLNHWGQKGPAEMSSKRIWTYRSCVWWARQNNVPFRMPSSHPFNPLPYLRLSVAAGSSLAAIRTIFAALWTTGTDPADPNVVASLAKSLHVPLERLTAPDVKSSLREATELATRKGVFGVPTFDIDGELFWGNDSVDFAAAYLSDPALLETVEMRLIETLPVGIART